MKQSEIIMTVILFILFWPAALIYLLVKHNQIKKNEDDQNSNKKETKE